MYEQSFPSERDYACTKFKNLCSFFQVQRLNSNLLSDTNVFLKISIFIKLASYYMQCRYYVSEAKVSEVLVPKRVIQAL